MAAAKLLTTGGPARRCRAVAIGLAHGNPLLCLNAHTPGATAGTSPVGREARPEAAVAVIKHSPSVDPNTRTSAGQRPGAGRWAGQHATVGGRSVATPAGGGAPRDCPRGGAACLCRAARRHGRPGAGGPERSLQPWSVVRRLVANHAQPINRTSRSIPAGPARAA
jgi:hypothetical protein